MKILVLTRFFTGMVDSVNAKKWNPKGMPAYYKLLEGLQRRGIQADVVMSCKRNVGPDKISRFEVFRFPSLDFDFHVLPYVKNRMFAGGTIERAANDLSHLKYCKRLVRTKGYDLIWCDQGVINFGAFFAYFWKKKVVVRLLGTGSSQKYTRGLIRRLDPLLIYLSFFAPFSYIICSRDGSGEKYFLSNFTNKKTPHEILLNGIDRVVIEAASRNKILQKYNLKEGIPIILFVGKMEEQKGCREFVDAIIILSKKNHDFYAIMVGEGPLLAKLKDKVSRAGLSSKAVFTGSVAHDEIYTYYNSSDIYVSLNKLGSLSNTVLEAINAKMCVLILSPAKKKHIDEHTHEVIPFDHALRVERNNIVRDLTIKLDMLLKDKSKISYFSKKSEELSTATLSSWEDRINYELDILTNLVNKKN